MRLYTTIHRYTILISMIALLSIAIEPAIAMFIAIIGTGILIGFAVE